MASTERSLGWATSGTGDGPAGGYDSTRWRANAQKSDGTGVLMTGSYMNMTGIGTSTLTIADGAYLINGYSYETNGSVTISTTGLSGRYPIILVANNTAGTVAVTQTGAGGTTIAASTVRAAIATSAQVTTITAAVGAANIATLGEVEVTAGSITNVTRDTSLFSSTMQLPLQAYATMTNVIGTTTSVPNATYTKLYFTAFGDNNNGYIVSSSNTFGGVSQFYAWSSGMYLVQAVCLWDANTTGSRLISFGSTGGPTAVGEAYTSIPASSIAMTGYQRVTAVVLVSGALDINVYQNSGGTRTCTGFTASITRL